jgi:hypothetical protein
LQEPNSFSWQEASPTSYTITAKSNSAFLLSFLESYDSHWKVFVNGNPLPEGVHVEVNGFANGWLVNDTGELTITVEYETQNLLTIAVAASIVLPAFLILLIVRKRIVKVALEFLRNIKK